MRICLSICIVLLCAPALAKECRKCAGKGQIVCMHCDGRGTLPVRGGRTTCGSCGGKGKTRCNICHGKGYRGKKKLDEKDQKALLDGLSDLTKSPPNASDPDADIKRSGPTTDYTPMFYILGSVVLILGAAVLIGRWMLSRS